MPAARSHSGARRNTVVTANLPAPASDAREKLSGVGKVKDRSLMAVVLIACVALTAGWVYGLGWAALKVIKLI